VSKPKKILISGAGLVGSLLSVLLGRRGYEVTIFERRADMRGVEVDSGRSINLALSSRGIHALEMAGLLDEVRDLLIPMRGRALHLSNGAEEFYSYGQREEELIYSVSRRDLNCLMMSAAEEAEAVEIRFNQSVEDVDFNAGELKVVDLTENESHRQSFDLLIGADGAGSPTREAMLAENGGESRVEFLDHDYKELEIPAGKSTDSEGGGVYQIEREALHIWPRGGYMLIALPNQNGSFTVTLFMPKHGENSFEQLKNSDQLNAFFEVEFPSAKRLIPDLESDFFSNAQGRLGTVRCSKWYFQNNALILGDASHAIVPFHGQGMNSGFEDCSELIRLLDKHEDNWNEVLPEFDRIRRPNADAIADMALENYVTMRESVADPKFQLKKELGFQLEQRYPERFVPRYSMVMFHRLPYAVALQRGEVQQAILSELVAGIEDIAEVDFAKAGQLVQQQLSVVDLSRPY
jgi:kynurenine 3-monooxygenase